MFDRVGNVVGSGVVIMAVSLLRVCDCICLCLDKRVVFFCAIFLPLFLMLLKSSFFFFKGGPNHGQNKWANVLHYLGKSKLPVC